MANSGIIWIHSVFDFSVRLLYQIANFIGISYEEINVWVFVIILPTLLVASLTLNFHYFIQNRQR